MFDKNIFVVNMKTIVSKDYLTASYFSEKGKKENFFRFVINIFCLVQKCLQH